MTVRCESLAALRGSTDLRVYLLCERCGFVYLLDENPTLSDIVIAETFHVQAGVGSEPGS